MRAGFVGAGRMGEPMVRRLLAGGHEVRVLSRNPERHAALLNSGATLHTRPSGIGITTDAVVLCVFTDDQVRAVCLDGELLSTMPPGSTLVIHTTALPQTMTAIAERAGRHGIDVVDAPVSGGPHDIAVGKLTVFAGGTPEAVGQVHPLLACYADPILHVGALGAGQGMKLLNNAAFAAQLGVVADIVRLAGRIGLDEATVLRALPHGSADSRALAGAANRGSISEFISSVGDFLAKDIAELRAMIAGLRVDLGRLDPLIDAVARPGHRADPEVLPSDR